MNPLMSLLAKVQAANIEWDHRLNHAGQGETTQIVLMQRHATTNALIDFLPIASWKYRDRGFNNENLPSQVLFELQIAEALITKAQANKTAAIKHGQQIFQIVQIAQGEPGIFQPNGAQRFWRFWLAPLEELP